MSSTQTETDHGFVCDCCGETWSPPKLSGGSKLWGISPSWQLGTPDGWRAVNGVSHAGKGDLEHPCRGCARPVVFVGRRFGSLLPGGAVGVLGLGRPDHG